jgi:hypothetical protein
VKSRLVDALSAAKKARVSVGRRHAVRRCGSPRRLGVELLEDRRVLSALLSSPSWDVLSAEGENETIFWRPAGPAPILNGQVENVGPDLFNNTDPRLGGPDGLPDNQVIGAIHTVLAHPTNPDRLWVGSVNGGVWRTNNATAPFPLWTPLTDELSSLSIGAMEFDPTDASRQTILAGRGAVSSFGQVSGPLNGLMLTTDGGDTWTEITPPTLQGQAISGVAKRGNLILAASNPFFSTATPGLFRSTDNGATFTAISGTGGLPPGGIFDLVGDPTNLNRFYVSVGGVGIFRSDDAGITWTDVSQNNGGLQAAIQVGGNTNLEMAVASNGRIYAGVILLNQLQLMAYSSDQGATWTLMDLPLTDEGAFGIVGLNPSQKPGGQGFIHFSIAVDPTNPDIVYVGGDRQDGIQILPGPDGLILTADDIRIPNSIGARDFSGRLFRGDASVNPTGAVPSPQWTPLTHVGTISNSAPHADSREITFDANGHLIEVDDGGIYRRTNPRTAAGDWFSMNGNLQVTEIHDVTYDTVSNVIVAGTQDVGTPQQFFKDSFVWGSVSTADGGDVVVDDISLRDQNQSIRYTSNQFLGAFRRRTYDENGNFIPGSEVFPALNVVQGAPLQTQFVTPAALNRVSPSRLIIAGGNSLYESFDRGETLTEIAPGVVVNVAVSGIAANPMVYGGRLNGVPNPEVLYVGFLNIFLARTDAASPVQSTPTAFPGGFIADITTDMEDWRRVFVVDGSDVYASFDAGQSWTRITGNLSTTSARSIEFVPNDEEGFIVVGTQEGVYKMDVNRPGQWQFFGTNLPNVMIFDMDYDEEDDVLVLGTMGRGAFIGQISRGEQIRGTKWIDRNGNGVRDIDEPGFPGITVYVDRNNNGVFDPGEPFGVTDALGDYKINVDIGVHIVREVVPLGAVQTFPASGFHRVVLQVKDEVVRNIDFGNRVEPGEIRGFKFLDENSNGVRDPGEPGQSGVIIQLLDFQGNLLRETMTGDNGAYRFDNLDPVEYQVREIVPPNQTQTFPSAAANGVHQITLQSTQIRIDVNFGNFGLRGSISGRKFDDANGNGIKDPDELGVAGAIIYVDLNRDGVLNVGEPSMVTDAFGYYTLPGLVPGVYQVREHLPPGAVQTAPGGNGAREVTVIAGRDTPNINFGNRRLFDFGDAPAPYPTTRAQNGASHGIRPGFFLGRRVDHEPDGQPHLLALGDDATGSSFEAAVHYDVGASPVGALVADLDRERGLDLVVVNQNSNTISVLLNNSDGTFADAVHYAVGMSPSRVVAADFDGDGDLDLAVSNTGSANVSILLNRGDGTFLPAVNVMAGAGPRGIAAGDLDGDGAIDLAVSNSTAQTVTVLFNDGAGGFANPLVLDINEGPVVDVAIGDLNRDGRRDLVVVNSMDDSISVLFNNGVVGGMLTFGPPLDFVVGEGPQAVILADFNRDGALDVATANSVDSTVSILLNRGTGTFFPKRDFDAGGAPHGLAAADIDGDGDRDLIVATRTTGLVPILLNNGNGVFTRGPDLVGSGVAAFVVAADFNADGGPDVVAINQFSNNVTVFASAGDDEDGVTFSPLVRGATASVQVRASAPGVLSAWIDFNADGDWNDPGEKIISDRQLTAGLNTIFFNVPAGAELGATFSRFRFSEQLGLGPTGPALVGEVEDYLVTIVATGEGQPVASYTNPQNPLDVNGDGRLTLNDVLLLVNDLRMNGVRELPSPPPAGQEPPPFLDPSGDGRVTLNDVLLVINGLLIQNAQANGEAEGESPEPATFVFTATSPEPASRRSASEPQTCVPELPAGIDETTVPAASRDEPADRDLAGEGEADWDDTLDVIAGDVSLAWEQVAR